MKFTQEQRARIIMASTDYKDCKPDGSEMNVVEYMEKLESILSRPDQDSEEQKSANEMLRDRFRELIAENEQLVARNKRQHEALTNRTRFIDGYSNPDQARFAQLENTVLHLTRALSELVGSRAVG